MKKILLFGNPNVGKSALFNRLTGANVIISNYPGTTVEFTRGAMRLGGERVVVEDAPGTYSLEPTSRAEEVAVQMLDDLGEDGVVVVVLDSTNLERGLHIALQVLGRRLPTVVALNMWDEARHTGVEIDPAGLQRLLGVPCVPTVAITGVGVKDLVDSFRQAGVSSVEFESGKIWSKVGGIVEEVQHLKHRHHTVLERLGDASVKPLTGIPFALVVIVLSFWVIRYIGEGLIGFLEPLFDRYWSAVALNVSDWFGNEGAIHDVVIGGLAEEEVGAVLDRGGGAKAILIEKEVGEVVTKDGAKVVLVEQDEETVERPYEEVIEEIERDGRARWSLEKELVVPEERRVRDGVAVFEREERLRLIVRRERTPEEATEEATEEKAGRIRFRKIVLTRTEVGRITTGPDGEERITIDDGLLREIEKDESARLTVRGDRLIVERERPAGEVEKEIPKSEVVGEEERMFVRSVDYGESFGLMTTGLFVPFGAVLPYVLAFFLVLSFLEDVGYLPRLAVLTDTVMHRLGLHGMAIVPMMLGLGCNVPGALSARILESKRERFIAATLMAIAVPCMAQIAMVFGLAGKFGPSALVPIFLALLVVWVVLGLLMNRFVKGESPEILVDVPPYRLPYWKALLKKVWMRMVWFVRGAVPWVLLGVLIVNLLYTLGIIDFIGDITAPVVTGLLGLPKDAVGALVIGFLRKDVAVGMLEPLHLSVAQIVVACVVLTVYFPCVATFAVLFKELGLKGLLKSTVVMLLTAVVVGSLLNLVMGLF